MRAEENKQKERLLQVCNSRGSALFGACFIFSPLATALYAKLAHVAHVAHVAHAILECWAILQPEPPKL